MAQITGRQKSEAKRMIVISNPSVCHYCKSKGLTESDKFCPNCGFPQRGSQALMKNFIWNINNKHTLLYKQKKAVSKARNILFVLSGLFAFFAILLGLLIDTNMAILISNFVVSLIYLSLGLWSKQNPFPAILTGFFVYISLMVINAVIEPTTLLKGLFMKVIVIGAFVYGYKGVKESEELEKELESIKKAKDFTIPDELSEV
ncbi:MAG: zinc ribbon domain-containing protein [Bacteroidetes bacterium]|nr:zinc ribbon domain-containing protein [Bacteroidota bacterium]